MQLCKFRLINRLMINSKSVNYIIMINIITFLHYHNIPLLAHHLYHFRFYQQLIKCILTINLLIEFLFRLLFSVIVTIVFHIIQ